MGKPARVQLSALLSSTPRHDQFWRVRRFYDGWNHYLALQLRQKGKYFSRPILKSEAPLESDTDVVETLKTLADKICESYWETRGTWTAYDDVEKFEGDHGV